MERKICKELLEWKNNADRKPLILQGGQGRLARLIERALDYYKEYLFVGGMPEAVEEYGKNHNPVLVRIIQQTILESYQNDMGKYNRQSEISKTRIVYKNISTQLAKENRKF